MKRDAQRGGPRLASARLKLAASYALFLVGAGLVVLVGVYTVLRFLPSYPLTSANPAEANSTVASRTEILQAVLVLGSASLLALAVIGSVGGWFIAGAVLRPLRAMHMAMEAVGDGRLNHRIAMQGPRDEFRQVADAFDGMLERLEGAFDEQERFAANASHELRTPLALTKTLLDVALRGSGSYSHHDLLNHLAQTNERAIGITDALLRLADANSVTASRVAVPFLPVLQTAIKQYESEMQEAGIALHCTVEQVSILGDTYLLGQLVSNLVQNAARHNVRNGQIWVALQREGASMVLTIDNTGMPIASEVVNQLTEPFHRGGRSTSSGYRGHGLGLALAAKITDVHAGTIDLHARDAGGLTVRVRLPRVTDSSDA